MCINNRPTVIPFDIIEGKLTITVGHRSSRLDDTMNLENEPTLIIKRSCDTTKSFSHTYLDEDHFRNLQTWREEAGHLSTTATGLTMVFDKRNTINIFKNLHCITHASKENMIHLLER